MRLELTNQEIYDELSKTVYGHDSAKKLLITAFNRLRAYAHAKQQGVVREDRPQKTNLVLVGDSGTGKTFMVTELGKVLQVPVIELDASKFTSTGSVSGENQKDVEKKILKGLQEARSAYPNSPEVVIIYVDEIDKVSGYYDGSSHAKWNIGVQGDFLKMIEQYSEEYLFIFSGAFDNLVTKTHNKLKEKDSSVGFTTPVTEKAINRDSYNEKIQDAVNNFGFMPELLGRMGLVVTLDQLSAKDLVALAKKSIVPKLTKTLDALGGSIRIPLSFIKKTVDSALKSGQGVRFLKSKLSEYCLEREFKLSYNLKKDIITLKKETPVLTENYDKDKLDEFLKMNIDPDDFV